MMDIPRTEVQPVEDKNINQMDRVTDKKQWAMGEKGIDGQVE